MLNIIPHYLQDHKEQTQHYVAETHFWNQEASVMALNHHYEQYRLGCVHPEIKILINPTITTIVTLQIGNYLKQFSLKLLNIVIINKLRKKVVADKKTDKKQTS